MVSKLVKKKNGEIVPDLAIGQQQDGFVNLGAGAVPDSILKQKQTFGGSFNETTGEQEPSFNTREEWQGYLAQAGRSSKGGVVTPKAQNQANIALEQDLKARAMKGDKQAQQQIIKQQLQQKTQPTQNPQQEQPVNSVTISPVQQTQDTTIPLKSGETSADYYNPNSLPNKISSFLGQDMPQHDFSGVGKDFIRGGAQIIDGIKSIFQDGKSSEIKSAEREIAQATQFIQDNIKAVADGVANEADVSASIDLYESSINDLEASQKNFGKLNLGYWLGVGKEIEQRLIIERAQLTTLRRELIIAGEAGRLKKLQSQFA